jgi:hypothetical protein
MTPLPFGSYGLREPPAFERPGRIIMAADLEEPVVTFDDRRRSIGRRRDHAALRASRSAIFWRR